MFAYGWNVPGNAPDPQNVHDSARLLDAKHELSNVLLAEHRAAQEQGAEACAADYMAGAARVVKIMPSDFTGADANTLTTGIMPDGMVYWIQKTD